MTERDSAESDLDQEELAAYYEAYLSTFAPLAPPETCRISWIPNALCPVRAGYRDFIFSNESGTPTKVRIWFPSHDIEPWSAPLLDGCGRYPLIMFIHGDCGLNNPDVENHYQQWDTHHIRLALCGYVVVSANFGRIGLPTDPNGPALQLIDNIRTFVREVWEHRSVLMPEPATAVYGHSYGALTAAVYARTRPVAAFAGLSGTWQDWPAPPLAFEGLNIPKLFMWGDADQFVEIDQTRWAALSVPKHKVVFPGATQWDYLHNGSTPCDESRGPCSWMKYAAIDFTTMFFSKYLPPELVPNLLNSIPDSLIPPGRDPNRECNLVNLGPVGLLEAVDVLSYAEGCTVPQIDWQTPNTRRVPFARLLPQANADHLVRKADLVPEYTGPFGPGSGPNWVFSQSPAPGARVSAGDVVRVTLRRGPIP